MKFPGVEFLETAPKFRKPEKENSWSCAYILHETSHQEISLSSRAVTAKQCTKKCNARTELLFWLLSLSLFCQTLWLPSPSSLLKLPITILYGLGKKANIGVELSNTLLNLN